MHMDGGRQEKIVWRGINRLDFGKKYGRNSPTLEESILQRAVMAAIMKTAARNTAVLQTPNRKQLPEIPVAQSRENDRNRMGFYPVYLYPQRQKPCNGSPGPGRFLSFFRSGLRRPTNFFEKHAPFSRQKDG